MLLAMGFLFAIFRIGDYAKIELPGISITAQAGIAIILVVATIPIWRRIRRRQSSI
jgi:hypothetical protein